MRSLVAEIATALNNKAPIPYVSRRPASPLRISRNDPDAQLRAVGNVGTLFAIVDRNITAVASARWHLFSKAASGKDEDRKEIPKHPALTVWNRPNNFFRRAEFIETFQQHLELVGEGVFVLVRSGFMPSGPPVELWPVRPDRLRPVPDPETFISGWVYYGPDGEKVPLELNEVIRIKRPCPWDPYCGMGAVQSILVDLQSVQYAAEWNRNFFENSAEPGGIIEIEEELDDREFKKLRERWNEQHRGVSRAHRVAILEKGKWVDRSTSMRDMQFAELRDISREVIREAFHFPKPLLGGVDDVNRANADAAEVVFGRWETKPRLDRIRDMLNTDFLPLFGDNSRYGMEFDYDNPAPADRELDAKELTAKAHAAAELVTAGWDAAGVLKAVDLPEIEFGGAPAPEPAPPSAPVALLPWPYDAQPGAYQQMPSARLALSRPLVQGQADHADAMRQVQQSYERALANLLTAWEPIRAAQIDAIVEQVGRIVDDGDLSELAHMTVPTQDAAATALTDAMTALGEDAARQAGHEAAAQGVTVEPGDPPLMVIAPIAHVTAAALASQLTAAAAGEAIRLAATAPQDSLSERARGIAAAVRAHLSATATGVRDHLGAALHRAQHAGRVATFRAAEQLGQIVDFYASEINDANQCGPCAEVDGRWLGNTIAATETSYPTGGFAGCLGRTRCRGHVTAVFGGQ
jgi:HK97 family phage portal protein